FLAAELVAFARRFVERARNMRPDRVAVRTARVFHVDRERRAGALHGDGGAFALALLLRGGTRLAFGRIVKGLTVSAAFTDRECSGAPGLRDKPGTSDGQSQDKHNKRAALRGSRRNNQNPLPRGKRGKSIEGSLGLGECEIEIRACARLERLSTPRRIE